MITSSDCKRIILSLILITQFFLTYSQSQTTTSCIIAQVRDTSGMAVPFVNVWIGQGKGTATDRNGNARICDINASSVTVTFSCIGYQTQAIKLQLKPGNNNAGVITLKNTATTMDQVVVTATRTDNDIMNTPVRVHVLTPKVLSTIPMQSVDDALKYTAGVNVSRPFGSFSSKATVSMRGLSSKEQGRVLVLLDGVPLNKSDGGSVDWNMIDLGDVQKIEITKGAGSAIYGGMAMGGVINIMSRKPQEKLQLRAALEYGTFNTMGARLNVGGVKPFKGKNAFYWTTNSFFRKSDGYFSQSEADRKENPYIVKSNFKEAGINVKTGLSFGPNHTIEAIAKYYNDRRGTGEKVYQPDGNFTDHDSYGLMLNYRGSVGKLSLKSSAYLLNEDYKKVNEYIKDDYTWYDVLSTRMDLGWLNSATYPVGNHTLTTGVDLKQGSVDAYDQYFTSTDVVYNEGKITTIALFAQDELALGERLRLIAGLRYDNATFYDGSFRIVDPSPETSYMYDYQVPVMPEKQWSALSPRLSIQYRFTENTRVYTNYSRGFRPSELEYLCRSGRIKGGFKIASPSLKPEYLNNFETGVDLKPFNLFTVSMSAYYSRGSDFQYYVSNGQTINMGFGERPILIRANISDVELYGAEAEVQVETGNGIRFTASYALAHSTILEYKKIIATDTVDLKGKTFTDVPEHLLSAGVTWTNKYINSSLYVRYTGSMYINDENKWDEILLSDKYPAYTTVDIKLWKDFCKHYKATFSVQNLLDKKYYDSKYAVCPGRFITAGIEVKL